MGMLHTFVERGVKGERNAFPARFSLLFPSSSSLRVPTFLLLPFQLRVSFLHPLFCLPTGCLKIVQFTNHHQHHQYIALRIYYIIRSSRTACPRISLSDFVSRQVKHPLPMYVVVQWPELRQDVCASIIWVTFSSPLSLHPSLPMCHGFRDPSPPPRVSQRRLPK